MQVPGGTGTAQEIVAAVVDKKVRRGLRSFILAPGIGQSFIAHGGAAEEVTAFIEAELAVNGKTA